MNNIQRLNSALESIQQNITLEQKENLEKEIKSIIQNAWDPNNGLPKDFKNKVSEKELLKRFVTQLIESSDIQPKSDMYTAKKLIQYIQELGEIEANDPDDSTNANKLIAKIEDIIREKDQALTEPSVTNEIKILFSPEGRYPAFLKNISDEGIKKLFDTIQLSGNEIMSEEDWERYFWNNFRPLFDHLTQDNLKKLGEEIFGEYFRQENNKALKIFLIACGQDKALELIGNYFNKMTEKLIELFKTLSPKVVPNNPKPANNI